VCDPEDNEVVNDAWPPPSRGTASARTVAPSLKVTVPVVTADPAVTEAVNVTGSPESDGFWEEAIDVDVVTVFEETTLRTTMLSTATPHGPVPGRTSSQVPLESCVYSQRSCAVVPAIPGSFMRTCCTPLDVPAHAARFCR
jgi:hypothetical protein